VALYNAINGLCPLALHPVCAKPEPAVAAWLESVAQRYNQLIKVLFKLYDSQMTHAPVRSAPQGSSIQ